MKRIKEPLSQEHMQKSDRILHKHKQADLLLEYMQTFSAGSSFFVSFALASLGVELDLDGSFAFTSLVFAGLLLPSVAFGVAASLTLPLLEDFLFDSSSFARRVFCSFLAAIPAAFAAASSAFLFATSLFSFFFISFSVDCDFERLAEPAR